MDDDQLDDYIRTGQEVLEGGLLGEGGPSLYDLAVRQEGLMGAKFKSLREKRHMSQEQVCEVLGERGLRMHQTTLAKIERGKRPLRMAEAHLIAGVFDLPLVAVFYLDVAEDDRPTELLSSLIRGYDEKIAHYREHVQRLQGDMIEMIAEDMAARQRAVQQMERLGAARAEEANAAEEG